MILRLSQKVASKIKAGKLPELPLDDNPFADWSSHLFVADRVQYLFLAHTTTLYSCLTHARGITNEDRFVETALMTISEFMEFAGQATIYRLRLLRAPFAFLKR